MNLITEFLAGMLLILVYICGQQMNDNGLPNVHFDVNMFREQTKKKTVWQNQIWMDDKHYTFNS